MAILPGVPDVYNFIFKIFETERLSHECGILCLAYIERIMETSGIRLFSYNWRRVVLSALILASKVLDSLRFYMECTIFLMELLLGLGGSSCLECRFSFRLSKCQSSRLGTA